MINKINKIEKLNKINKNHNLSIKTILTKIINQNSKKQLKIINYL